MTSEGKKPMTLEKFIAIVFMLALSVGSTVAVNVYGWGLQPKSWLWIIGVGFFWNLSVHTLFKKILE